VVPYYPHTPYTHHSEVRERPRLLDVLQGLLEIAQLLVDNRLGLLSALDSLRLERLNSLDLPVHIVRLGLESVELLLDVVDDGLVLEDGSVLGEVDGLGLLGENGNLAAGVVVALLELLQGSGGGALQAQLGAELGPVELKSSAALLQRDALVF
jgi:hypothetical protein